MTEPRCDIGDWLLIAALAIGCAFLGFLVGCVGTMNIIHREAIGAGAAEHVLVNPATGQTEFRWKGSPAND